MAKKPDPALQEGNETKPGIADGADQMRDAPDPPILTVRGPEKGRWRAGIFFGPEPVEVEMYSLTEDQLAAIHGDPQLTVIGRD